MATKLPAVLPADFTTSLATELSVGGTSFSLQSNIDDDGVTLNDGLVYLTLDGANSLKEHFQGVKTGTSIASVYSVSRQGVLTSGAVRKHRIGATASCTDFATIKFLNDLLKGTTDLNASTPLSYDGAPSITTGNQLVTKTYVDGVAIAGGADSSTTTKGITKMSVAPVSPTNPIAVGDNDGRVPTQGENDALVGDNTDIAVGTGNKFVTQTGLQHNAEKYAEDTSGSSTAYVVTLSPIPTSLTDGMVIFTKIVNANTTTTPTINVNSLGAKTIKKTNGVALVAGDIGANQHIILMYDGTDMILQNPVVTSPSLMTVASGNLKLSADTERNTASGTWVLLKSITVNRAGIVRYSIDTHGANTNWSETQTRLGTIVLASTGVNNASYSTSTADFYVPAGGRLDVYAQASSTTVYIRNFRIYFDTQTLTDGAVITD